MKRLCIALETAKPWGIVSAAGDHDAGMARLRCLVGEGDEIRRGILVPSPLGPVCSLPVEDDEDDADE